MKSHFLEKFHKFGQSNLFWADFENIQAYNAVLGRFWKYTSL